MSDDEKCASRGFMGDNERFMVVDVVLLIDDEDGIDEVEVP